jgi:hybrid cluster-associated redox disulfide protein
MTVPQMPDQIMANSLVQAVVERYPQTIAVFAGYGLQCVGCYISPYHTIADTAREYTMTLDALLVELNQAVASVGQQGLQTQG